MTPDSEGPHLEALLDLATSFLDRSSAGSRGVADRGFSEVEPLYRTLVEQVDAILFMAYLDQGIGDAFISPSITEALGYSREEWLDDPIRWHRTIHPDDRSRWSREAAAMIATGTPLRSTYRVVARDGRILWFRCDARILARDDGTPWFIHGVAFDVTEQKQAEERFRTLLEAAPDAMVIVGHDGRIVLVNSLTETMFQYGRDELLGEPVELLLPDAQRERHRELRTEYAEDPHPRPMGADLDLWGRRKDGTSFPAEISLAPIEMEEGIVFSAAVRDATERRADQERILASLREKEALLHEVHHRVKNNLSVVSSLFYLQSARTQDPHVAAILQDSRDRVRAMAMVHETLYSDDGLASVDLATYGGNLARQLFQSYAGPGDRVRLDIDIEPVQLDLARAVPCGLVLNEMITNALKHAFPDEREGFVRVAAGVDGDTCVVTVEDDGIGIPDDFDPATTDSLGMLLMQTLAQQLDAVFALERREGGGTRARLVIPHGGATP